jgi:hypothetical protein
MRRTTRSVGLAATISAAALLVLPVGAVAQDVAPLSGTASTADRSAEPTGNLLSVTGVQVGTHDGFDRITFEVAGDGEPGWRVGYEDAPVGDASGLPVEVAGSTALRVVLVGVALPGDEVEGATTFLDDVAGPQGGSVLEVVNDSVFEGHHTFFVGLDERVPFRLARLPDPTRVVIDLVHGEAAEEVEDDADDDEAEPTPVPEGGVEAGFGGTAGDEPFVSLVLLLGAALLAVGAGLVLRRRPTG